MDANKKQKSALGNDKKLDREKNKVTGVKTSDQRKENKKHGDDEKSR
jgi:hypothetical protein